MRQTGPGTDRPKSQNKRKIYESDRSDLFDTQELASKDGNELRAYAVKRQKRKRKKQVQRRRLIAAAVLVGLLAVIALFWNEFEPSTAAQRLQSFFDTFGKSKYPVEYSDGTLRAAALVGNGVGVLTDTTFLVYSKNGDLIGARPHGFNNPAAVYGGEKALIYDRGGKQFRVETRYGEPYKASAAYNITTAAMGDSGNFAVVTDSDNYLSELTVFSGSNKSVFKWDSTTGRILSAALSPDGKMLAAVVVGAKNGDLVSDLYIFNLSQDKPVAVKNYTGTLFYSIRFKDNKRIAAVGDDKAVFLYASGEQKSVYTYADRELVKSENGDGPTVLAFKKDGSNLHAVSLDGEGKLLGEADVPGSSKLSIAVSDEAVVFSLGDRLWRFSAKLANGAEIPVVGETESALAVKDNAYVFGNQSVNRYSLK